MRKSLVSAFISDLSWMVRVPVLLACILYPLFIVILLRYVFPLLAAGTLTANALKLSRYYSPLAISLISAIPFIYGLIFSYRDITEYRERGEGEPLPAGKGRMIRTYARPAFSCLLCLMVVLPSVFITRAVNTEGWLRNIYISILFSLMAPFVYAFSRWLAGNRQMWRLNAVLSLVFLLAGPAGLFMRHPWNYLVFFSPFYWINWAWIISKPAESAAYGAIAVLVTASAMVAFNRRYLKLNRSL